jgi:hypothetical protein
MVEIEPFVVEQWSMFRNTKPSDEMLMIYYSGEI